MTADNPLRPPAKTCAEDALRGCEESRQHAREGRWEEAVTAAARAIAADPDCLEAYQLRASLLASECDWPAAIPDLTELLRLAPRQAETYVSRAFAYALTGQFERAVLNCNRAVELDSLNARAYETRAYALRKLGRRAEAEADRRRSLLLRSTPEETEGRDRRERIVALLDRGNGFVEAGHFEEAVQAYSAVLLEAPRHVEARRGRGMAYHSAGRFREASDDLAETWRLREERDQAGRGYLVAVEGPHGEIPWSAFPDNGEGRHQAVELATNLATDPAPVEEVQARLGGFERAKVYRFRGDTFRLIDRMRTESVQTSRGKYPDELRPVPPREPLPPA